MLFRQLHLSKSRAIAQWPTLDEYRWCSSTRGQVLHFEGRLHRGRLLNRSEDDRNCHDNSCFTLGVAGQGVGHTQFNTRSTFSAQMASDPVENLVNYYQVSLSELFTSSYSCQNASLNYGATLNLSNLDLNIRALPPCFYNLPVFRSLHRRTSYRISPAPLVRYLSQTQ